MTDHAGYEIAIAIGKVASAIGWLAIIVTFKTFSRRG